MFNTKSAGRWMNLRFFLLSYAFLPRKFQINLSTAAVSDSSDPVRVILPFKDQSSADTVRRQLQDLSLKIHTTVSPVFVSQKIERDLEMREAKPPLVNQPCLVYKLECDLYDAGYVGYTSRHLHQRIEEHKSASSSSTITFVLNILQHLKILVIILAF